MKLRIIAAAFSLAALSVTPSYAFPERTVTIMVPFPAGGGVDALTRPLAEQLSKRWGVSVIVENRPGAGGNIGTEVVARSEPDGHMLVVGTSGTHGINELLIADTPFRAKEDFEPVTVLAYVPNMLTVNPSVPAQSVQELVALAQERPGELSYGSAGVGTPTHLFGELFASSAGIELLHVPYKGGPEAVNDVLAGRVDMMFNNIALSIPQVQAGKVRALGVTSSERAPIAPDVPTIAEAGVEMPDVTAWYALFAPAGTPPEVIAKIQKDVAEVIAMDETAEFYGSLGAQAKSSTPEQLATIVEKDQEIWRQVMVDAGLLEE